MLLSSFPGELEGASHEGGIVSSILRYGEHEDEKGKAEGKFSGYSLRGELPGVVVIVGWANSLGLDHVRTIIWAVTSPVRTSDFCGLFPC